MYQDCQVDSWEEEHVNPHLQLANCQFAIFGCPEWDRVVLVRFQVEMASDWVSDVCVGLLEEHPFLCPSSVAGDFLLCHFGQEVSRPCGSDKS